MDQTLQMLAEQGAEVLDAAAQQGRLLLLPSRLVQFAIIAGALMLAWVLRRRYAPRLREWMRTRDGWPRWRLRLLVVLHRNLQLGIFVVLLWLSVWIMAQYSPFPSRRFLLELAASLATAWLLVAVAGRLVQNRLLRRTVTWGAWIYVTLYYLGLIEDVARALDSLAIEFGEIRLSALMIIQGLAIATMLLLAIRLASRLASERIRSNEDLSPSMQVLAIKGAQAFLYITGFFVLVRAIGFDLTGLAVLSGAIGVGIGFGLQKVVSNLVSGIIILLDKSIKPGDVISIGENFGWINKLSARYVSITTRDGREFLIPNEDFITGQVLNWSHSDRFVRLDVHFGCAYKDDPHTVRRIAVDAARGVDRVLSARPPVCHITAFGPSSIDYVLRFWITDPSGGLTNIRGNVYLALWDAFQENGITIPFPQREVRLLEPEPAGAGTGSTQTTVERGQAPS
jgi:small-conductance mechanosensitive channel